MILDIKSAFLYGEMEDIIYIELPPEDPDYGKGFVGLLDKPMYGTRKAPQVWNNVVRDTLFEFGFKASVVTPSLYFHPQRRRVSRRVRERGGL